MYMYVYDKTQTRPEPVSSFFLNPYLALFFIESSKTRPIRIGSDRVPTDWVVITILRTDPDCSD